MAHFPESVTRTQLTEACAAFAAVIGFDPKMAFFPLHVDRDGITLPGVVVDGDGKKPLVNGYTDDAAALSVPVRIEVAG